MTALSLKILKFKNYQLLILSFVIAVSIFFRFWQIRNYVVFLGDEGRDMMVMRKIFTEKRLPFLGPTASVGGFYLGPAYYWMAAPFLWLFRFDPVGPSYFVAALGVGTVWLLYKLLKEPVGFWPAIAASSLYATAPLIVRYARSSWNPNPLPFFALLVVYFLYLGVTKERVIFFLLAGASFGIAIQLHYLAIILLAISGLIVLVNTHFKKWPIIFILTFLGSLITFSPFLGFEIKNDFPNFKTILEFVTRGTTVGFKTSNLIGLASNIGNILLEDLTKIQGTLITKVIFWVLTLGGLFGLAKYWRQKNKKFIFSASLIWFIGGILGLRFYAGQIFDYYFEFMFVAPFLLLGSVLALAWPNRFMRLLAVVFLVTTIFFFVSNSLFKHQPNRLIDQTTYVAEFVVEKAGDQPFNFALISDHNSDHAYRYFLEVKAKKPKELEEIVTDQLLVVCESQKCAPLGHPIWEIAGFGRAEIAGEWELADIGIKVFKLTHWLGAPNPAGKPAIKGG